MRRDRGRALGHRRRRTAARTRTSETRSSLGRSIAVDSKGNIYVADGSTLRVRRPDGTVEILVDRTKANPDEVTIGNNTKHLGLDADENVLLADDFGHAIKKYLVAEKKMVLVAGDGKQGSAGVGGPPLDAQLSKPHGVYFHRPSKTIYIGDSQNNRVLKILTQKPTADIQDANP